MGRTPCCEENGLKKGPWTPEEDLKLVQYIEEHGHGSWRSLPKLAGLNRCGKSCRLRWTNYLRPDIKRGKFSPDEEQTILNLHSILGNKWSAIASHLPGRTDNEIKNYWNTHLKKKLIQMGFDPMTHRPRTDFFATLQQLVALAKLRQLIGGRPWDDVHAARLEAEASQAAELQYLQHLQHLAMTSSASESLSNNLTSADLHNDFLLGSQTTNPFSAPSLTPATDHVNGLKQTNPLPGVQIDPCCLPVSNEANQSFTLTAFSQGESSLASPFMSPHSPLPPLTDISFGNQGDASSASNCGDVSGNPCPFWPELLFEDPFIADFA